MESEIKSFFKGEVLSDKATLEKYSRDASLFKVMPKLVVYPKDSQDISALVKWVSEKKKSDPTLSLTMRSAGSDMSGGPLGESIIVDVTRYLNKIGEIQIKGTEVEPGVFYRDFEPKTLEKGLILPCFPASKNLCALGGMIGNNCAGEKTLRYGKMEHFVRSSHYVFSDGVEYEVKPLSANELEKKRSQDNFEGKIYRELYQLIVSNRDLIEKSRPKVTKNSAGYFLWNVWDGHTFDLNRLLTGAQGTLGLMTRATVSLKATMNHHDLIALFFDSWDDLPEVVNAILPYDPESLETFDEDTLKLGIHFMPEIAKKVGENPFSFALKFLPEALIGVRMLGIPKLIVLVEIAEGSEMKVKIKVEEILKKLKPFRVWHRVIEKDSEEEKFWVVRRESFNLLRQHAKRRRTAPFIDDFCIPVEKVPEFLPKAKKILEDYDIDVNIAGHAGNGNFHIIPLMDLSEESEREKLIPVADKFYSLVSEYQGSTTGEHNDGIVRTPYLDKMYKPEMLELFKRVKVLFDPQNIFNPGKKVPSSAEASTGKNGTLEYFQSHIAKD